MNLLIYLKNTNNINNTLGFNLWRSTTFLVQHKKGYPPTFDHIFLKFFFFGYFAKQTPIASGKIGHKSQPELLGKQPHRQSTNTQRWHILVLVFINKITIA